MGTKILYCGGCGVRILGSDFDEGRASHHADRSYCAACRAVPLPAPAPAPAARPDTRVRRSLAKPAAPVRRLLARPGVRKGPIALALGAAAAAAAIVLASIDPVPAAPAVDVPVARATLAPIPVPRPTFEVQAPVKDDGTRREAAARALEEEMVETGTVLADEGRFDDALAKIDTFPRDLRNTRAWSSLDGFRRQIEFQKRQRSPR